MSEHLISAAELVGLVGDPDVVIFDVRHNLMDHAAGQREYLAGHIPGARFLDHETDLAAPKTGQNGRHPLPERAEFAARMASCGVQPGTLVVAYDASGGMYAAHLWWMLRWAGHDTVRVLDGGWQAWVAADYSVSQATPASHGAQPGSSEKGVWSGQGTDAVKVEEVLANVSQPRFTVLDARAANRFRGEVEPMDPVAGHIPGALNRPNTDNLQADGRFKPADVLAAEFAAVLGPVSPDDVVHQCGSGITACHNLLAMEVAGLSGSRLYAGSWSEWCADPERPVAKG